MYSEGISKEGNLLDIAVIEEIVQKGGAWFSYKDARLGQGRENSKKYLKDNYDLALEIENLIRVKYNLPLTIATINEKRVEEDTLIVDW